MAVKLRSSGLGNYIDSAISVAALVSGEITGFDLHLGQRIHRREQIEAAIAAGVHCEHSIVGIFRVVDSPAVDRDQGVTFLSDAQSSTRLRGGDARTKREELREISPVERKLTHLNAAYQSADLACFGVKRWHSFRNGNGFPSSTQLQANIDCNRGISIQPDILLREGFKAGMLSANLIGSDWLIGKHVVTLLVCCDGAGGIRA